MKDLQNPFLTLLEDFYFIQQQYLLFLCFSLILSNYNIINTQKIIITLNLLDKLINYLMNKENPLLHIQIINSQFNIKYYFQFHYYSLSKNSKKYMIKNLMIYKKLNLLKVIQQNSIVFNIFNKYYLIINLFDYNIPPPPILQPKVISEYVPDKSEEVMQIESYYRNQHQYDQNKHSEEIKISNNNSKFNQSDLINKLQFTIDSKQNQIIQSEYSNKQLAKARHLGNDSDQINESPQFKPARTQTIKDFSFTQNTQNRVDNIITTKIYLILSEIAILKFCFGYLVGVQERISIAILIIALSSLLEIILFSDWMLLITKPQMVTYLMLLYILFFISMLIGIYAYEILIKVCYCLLFMYSLRSFQKLLELQTIKSALIQSGISLFILIIIKFMLYIW